MAGVFEVEVDGVEHDHGLEHQARPAQASTTSRCVEIKPKIDPGDDGCHSEPRCTD